MSRYRELSIAILLFCDFCHSLEFETTTIIPSGEESDTVITELPVLSKVKENVEIKSLSVDEESNNITAVQGSTDQQTISSTSADDTSLEVPESIVQLGNQKEILNVFGTNKQKEITFEDLSNDLLSWEPPHYIKASFPAYISGFDHDDQPIWIGEVGKYDLHSFLRRGQTAQKDLERYIARMAKIALNSLTWKNPRGYKGSAILDFDGLKMSHYAQFESIAFLLRQLPGYRKLLEDHVDHVVIINANYPAHALINLWRPVIGRIMEVVDIYGNDKSKWIPHILRLFPQDSLPEWYGGFKNFTPYKVFGV